MWPWGHLAFAYVLYSAYVHLRYRLAPEWPGVLLAVLGSQAPDLIDKPLGWSLHVLPGGRTLAHSLFFATAIVLLVAGLLRRYDLPGGAAFAIGYYSHLVGDSYQSILSGRVEGLTFLLWPLYPVQGSEPSVGILQYLLDAKIDGQLVSELLFAAFVVVWWLLDGAPGAAAAWNIVRRRLVRPVS